MVCRNDGNRNSQRYLRKGTFGVAVHQTNFIITQLAMFYLLLVSTSIGGLEKAADVFGIMHFQHFH